MKKEFKLFAQVASVPVLVSLVLVLAQGRTMTGRYYSSANILTAPPDTPVSDTTKLRFPIKDRKNYQFGDTKRSPFDLRDPSNINNRFELDSSGKSYRMNSMIGDKTYYRPPATLDFDKYLEYEKQKSQRDYFRERAKTQNVNTRGGSLIPQLYVSPKIFDKIFGGSVIDIRPQGSAELTFGGNFNTVRNPALTVKQQKNGQFDFKQKIQLNAVGKIGEKLKLNFNYDTEATFDFENQMKLDYQGDEDDIIKKIELGNVSLPLNGTLIPGSQSLFGIKTQMQFGRLTWTAIATQQKGKTTETEITGGAQTTTFDIQADNYDANRHYFLSHYFQQNYNRWLDRLPIITSDIVVNRVEVWVTNTTYSYDNVRFVLATMDLGEPNPYNKTLVGISDSLKPPANDANILYTELTNPANPLLRKADNVINELDTNPAYDYLVPIRDYQKTNARLLTPSEYTVNTRLGYISLSNALNNDQVLAVAFEYTKNGVTYKVGEFSADLPPDPNVANVLFLKLLKGTNLNPSLPIWKLMMKNIYSLNAFQVQPKDFKLNVVYADDPSGADLNYLPEPKEPKFNGIPLISVLGLDNVNQQQEPTPDGVFDFIPDITINATNGKIIFPEVEPFGEDLAAKFDDKTRAQYYAYNALYDSTRYQAQQQTRFNKFFLRGSYQGSSSSEISLNSINVQKGSVKVTSNGRALTENVDYTVDYNMGRVRIINTGLLNSGETIKVTSENNSLFNIQQKTLLGSRFDYKISNDFLLGGTLLHQYEKTITTKVNIGDEPIKNTVLGLDGTYKTDSRLITKLIDKLPFIETKEISTIQVSGEFATIMPGVPKILGGAGGISYIDNFEGSETPIDLRLGNNWVLASTPKYQPGLFPETNNSDRLVHGYNRARIAWYTIDPSVFYRGTASITPAHLTNEDLSDHDVREILQSEVFPNKQIQSGLPQTLPTFDLAYYPREKGPYNYNFTGINTQGQLNSFDPEQSWAGIMRKIETNDFEAANIDYIEIWMMDPFINNPNLRGDLYINLGNISEDVIPDSRRSYENGLPKDTSKSTVDKTQFGYVPRAQALNNAFDNEPSARIFQDIGLDGMNNDDERNFYRVKFLDSIAAIYGTNSDAYRLAESDPSNDDYHFYRGTDLDSAKASILERYKRINDPQGNSPTPEQSIEEYPTASTFIPNDEDINRDNTINELEEYFQYRIELNRGKMVVGQNFIADSITLPVTLVNGLKPNVTWYQLKIPIRSFTEKIGGIYDFRSIRFMRIFMKGFNDQAVLRFGQLQLVRADWRKYLFSLENPGEFIPIDPNDQTQFVVSTVNLEENGNRAPIPYQIPPGIIRGINVGTTQLIQENEQSLSLKVVDMRDGDARAVFKTTRFDVRNYKKLKMFIHAESLPEKNQLKDGEMTAFIRIGTDFNANYYEYEIPLKITQPVLSGTISAEAIWLQENEIDLDMEEFFKIKLQRDQLAPQSLLIPYSGQVNGKTITVVGIPDLSNIKVIMLGVRNPNSDGNPSSGEVWFNELRVEGFNNPGGWAATMRIVGKLADLGNFTLAGSRQTVGYGGIDKKLNERSRTDQTQYSFSTNLEMGKFFPAKWGITIPLFYSYGQNIIKPLFNPLNPDILLSTTLNLIQDPEKKEEVRLASYDVTTNKSFSLNNVKKNRMEQKRAPRPYDIENFFFSYIYNEQDRHNQALESYFLKTYKVQAAYGFQKATKYFEPFKKLKFLGKSKYFELIRDINLGIMPAQYGVRVDVDRRYGEQMLRNNDKGSSIVFPTYDKNFTMTRVYDLQHNLTKTLNLNYFSTANTRIDEPNGKIDTKEDRDTIIDNLIGLGRKTKFDQTVKLNYNVPFNKFPLTNWISLSTSYQASYGWITKPPAATDTLDVGNTIQNSRNYSTNGQFNMITLYNKIPFLAKLNKANVKKEVKKAPVEGDTTTLKAKKQEEPGPLSGVAEGIARLLMTLKNVTVNYSNTEGTQVPGFRYKPEFIGMDFNQNAPGMDFILGDQDSTYHYKAARKGWIVQSPYFTNFYMRNRTTNFAAKAFLEPMQDLKIDLNISKTAGLTHQGNFQYDEVTDNFIETAPREMGNYTITYNFFNTAFSNEQDGVSKTFDQFENNRFVIATRLQQENTDRSQGFDTTNGFPSGYGPQSPEVLVPAFLAAYKGNNANSSKVGLSAFPSMPNPNWRIQYNGLSRLKFMKKIAKNVNIQHQYSSTYSVGSYEYNTSYKPSKPVDPGQNLQPKYNISTITIAERFSPLLSVDVTLNNDMTLKLEMRKDRMLMLNTISNLQLSEQKGSEFVFTLGYRTKELTLPLKIRGKKIYLENDINFRLDFSVRNTKTVVRKIDDISLLPTPVQGNTIITIKPSIDYMVNEKISLRMFYNRVVTKPAVATSFPTAITSFGITLRYTLQ